MEKDVKVFRVTKAVYIVFAVILYLPLFIIVIYAVIENDYNYYASFLMGFPIFCTLLYIFVFLCLKRFKITIDTDYLKYNDFLSKKIVPLKDIRKANSTVDMVRKGIIHQINIYTTSLELPELKINVGPVNSKDVKSILDILNNKLEIER